LKPRPAQHDEQARLLPGICGWDSHRYNRRRGATRRHALPTQTFGAGVIEWGQALPTLSPSRASPLCRLILATKKTL